MLLQWTIDADGRVANPEVLGEEFRNLVFTTCVTQKVSTWDFPKSAAGGPVVFPFRF